MDMQSQHDPMEGLRGSKNPKKKLFLAVGILVVLGAGAAVFMLMSGGSTPSASAPTSAEAALDMPPPTAGSAAPVDVAPPMPQAPAGGPADSLPMPDAAGNVPPPMPGALPDAAGNVPPSMPGSMPPAAGNVPSPMAPAPALAGQPAPVAAPLPTGSMAPSAAAPAAWANAAEMCKQKFDADIAKRGLNPTDHVVARDNYVARCVEFVSKHVPLAPATSAPVPIAPPAAPTPTPNPVP